GQRHDASGCCSPWSAPVTRSSLATKYSVLNTRYSMAVADGLLVLLRIGARHGYQLKADFEERTAGTWPLNTGQVYTTLDRLVRDGFVEAVDDADGAGARRRPYRLTELGRERAAKWLAQVDGGLEPPRDDLTMRV